MHSDTVITLDRAERDAWDRLIDGVARAASEFHTISVATTGLNGRPQCRTVVLRKAELSTRQLWFHTDARSPKIAELRASPWASLIFYDRAAKTQVRADCSVIVHTGDHAATERWAASKPSSRLCYSNPNPSTLRVPAPPTAATTHDPDAFNRFAAVECTIQRMEWLLLKHSGHVRAEFVYDPSGARIEAAWLAP